MRVALLMVLFSGATGSLRNSPAVDRSLSTVKEVRDMMEQVRQETEGGEENKLPAVALSANKKQITQRGEFFKGEFQLDNYLLSKADQTQELVNDAEKLEDPGRPKKASLVATKETVASKAARFFAAHDMNKVAHMLGKEFVLSATAAQEASTEHKVALAKFNEAKAPVQSDPIQEDLDVNADDDDDEVKERAHWAAVEALKKRSP